MELVFFLDGLKEDAQALVDVFADLINHGAIVAEKSYFLKYSFKENKSVARIKEISAV